MIVSLTDRFRRCCRDLRREEHAAVLKAILDLDRVLGDPHRHAGAGLRKLSSSGYWEVRVGLSQRAVFKLVDDQIIFVFLGTHDEVQRFLRNF